MRAYKYAIFCFKKRLKNSQGFSLPELMVSMGISMGITLLASIVFMFGLDTYTRTVRKTEAESEMLSLMWVLRSSFATAVKVEYGGPANLAKNATTNRGPIDFQVGVGKLFSITDDDVPLGGTNYSGDESYLVALFNRETAGINLRQSQLHATQIVYQRPNIAGNAIRTGYQASGAIYVDLEWNNALVGGWTALSPRNSSQIFTRLTNFEINNVKVMDVSTNTVNPSFGSIQNVLADASTSPCYDNAGAAHNCFGRPVVSAEVTMVMRYFTSGNERNWHWCNSLHFSDVAGCNSLLGRALFFDLTRKLNPIFLNNNMHGLSNFSEQQYLPRRSLGNIHFMVPWIPQGGKVTW